MIQLDGLFPFYSILMIWVLTVVLIYMAIVRIIQADYDVDADAMLVTSAAGVMFNLVIGGLLMFGHQQVHHGHAHVLHNQYNHDQRHRIKLAVEHNIHSPRYENSMTNNNDSESRETTADEKTDVRRSHIRSHVLHDNHWEKF